MRLGILDHGHRLRARVFLRLVHRLKAIADALNANLVFNIMNRLANAFDLTWDSDEHVRLSAKVLRRIDYRLPRFLMR